MSTLYELAQEQRRRDGVCTGCNNNHSYRIGDLIVECKSCKPKTHAAIEKLQQESIRK